MIDRRVFLQDAAAAAVAIALPGRARKAEPDLAPVFAQIAKRHEEAVERLQQWIRQPSIAAENRGMNEGCELTMRMLREAGFGRVTKLPSDGQPGIFATLDAGAPRTLGLYLDRKSTRLNSSHSQISYAVFCLKKKKNYNCSSRFRNCV